MKAYFDEKEGKWVFEWLDFKASDVSFQVLKKEVLERYQEVPELYERAINAFNIGLRVEA